MDDIEEKLEHSISKMASRADFLEFVQLLQADYEHNIDFWENQSLGDFLKALHAYASGDGGYLPECAGSPETPTWQCFADMLAAARAFYLTD
jgi:hypothetical protein